MGGCVRETGAPGSEPEMKWMTVFLERIDRAWARFEGWLTVAVLVLMVLVAAFQAAVRNLTLFDVGWANELLTDMDWADSLLRKSTL